MKVAIPVNEDKKTICISFGRTPLFALTDTVSGALEYLDNSAAASQGGAGIKAAQMLLDHGVDAVLTPRCGENAGNVFKEGNVKLYRSQGSSLEENITAFQDGKLQALTDIHPGFHGHGSV